MKRPWKVIGYGIVAVGVLALIIGGAIDFRLYVIVHSVARDVLR